MHHSQPKYIPYKIYTLSTDEYTLKKPLDIIFEFYADEVLAVLPEVGLYGEGDNQMAAIENLKDEILDLYDELCGIPDDKLGKHPRVWKKTLELMVEKCQ